MLLVSSSSSLLVRMRAEPRQRRGRTLKTLAWRVRSHAPSPGPCYKRLSLGWPRLLLLLKTKTGDLGTVCPTPPVHLRPVCPLCPRQHPPGTPPTRALPPSDCCLQIQYEASNILHTGYQLILHLNILSPNFLWYLFSCYRITLYNIDWCHCLVRFPGLKYPNRLL